jgi:VWFA-related protein
MLCGVLALPAGGQDTPTETLGEQRTFASEVEVTVANIDVFVRDRDGRPVRDLTAEDFRILQDGVEMTISNFTSVSAEPLEPAPLRSATDDAESDPDRSTPRPIEPNRVILIFDNENLFPPDRRRVMNGVRTFVDEVMTTPVEMMVLSTRRAVDVKQPFTTDRDEVMRALDLVSKESAARVALDRERRAILVEMERFANQAARESYVEFLADVQGQVFKVQMQGRITAYMEQESGVLRDTLRNLHEVVRMVSGIDGRSSIVYVSNGLSMTPGLDLMHEFAEVFLDNTIYTRIAQRTFAPEFRALTDAANREGVSLYTVDASGLKPPIGFDADDRYVPEAAASWVATANQQESMGFMADATGGIAVLDSNDVTEGLRLVRDDFANFYSIGYRISAAGDDTAHRIEVQLPQHPEYEIRHRKWLIEVSLETRVRERVLQTLVRDLEFNPLGVELTSGPSVEISARRWEVPLIVSIPVNRLGLAPADDDLVAQLELFICVRDERGRETPVHQRTLQLRIPQAGFAPDREQRYELSLQMTFREERHVVAVGLVDRVTEQTSYHRIMVDVP